MSEANLNDTETIEAPIPSHTPGHLFRRMPQEELNAKQSDGNSIKLDSSNADAGSRHDLMKFDESTIPGRKEFDKLGYLHESEISNGEVSERSVHNSHHANMNSYALKTNKTPETY